MSFINGVREMIYAMEVSTGAKPQEIVLAYPDFKRLVEESNQRLVRDQIPWDSASFVVVDGVIIWSRN